MAASKPAAKKPVAAKKAASRKPAAKPAPVVEKPGKKRSLAEQLPPKVERFISEYLIDLNGTQAYLRSYPGAKETSARTEASRLLANPHVQAAIAAERAKTAQKLEITREALLAEVWGIVRADPRELIEYRVQCCRHCHGPGHAYQWRSEEEFEQAKALALVDFDRKRAGHRPGEPIPQLKLPSDAGGFKFDARKQPSEDCPECLGVGVGRTILKDTRKLSPQALSLFAGIKETKEGFEVKMHSKLDAAEKIAKHLGLYEKDNEQKGKSLAAALGSFVAGLHERKVGRLPMVAPQSRPKGST